MRKLIKDRLLAIWCDELEQMHDIGSSELGDLSDEDLLDLYDDVLGFSG